MKNKSRQFLKNNWPYMLASFFIPFLIMAIIYLSIGIYPGSSRSVLASDAFSQFQIFTQALTMFFMENKVFSIRGMLLWD